MPRIKLLVKKRMLRKNEKVEDRSFAKKIEKFKHDSGIQSIARNNGKGGQAYLPFNKTLKNMGENQEPKKEMSKREIMKQALKNNICEKIMSENQRLYRKRRKRSQLNISARIPKEATINRTNFSIKQFSKLGNEFSRNNTFDSISRSQLEGETSYPRQFSDIRKSDFKNWGSQMKKRRKVFNLKSRSFRGPGIKIYSLSSQKEFFKDRPSHLGDKDTTEFTSYEETRLI